MVNRNHVYDYHRDHPHRQCRFTAIVAGFSTTAWVSALVLWFVCGISIGSGYHRLFSHRTYEAHWLLRLFFALGGALALQNSILVWCARHRAHHAHVDDEDKDPHSIRLGFWYAHIGWMLRDYEAGKVNMERVPDLERDPDRCLAAPQLLAADVEHEPGLAGAHRLDGRRFLGRRSAGRIPAPGGQPPGYVLRQLSGPHVGSATLHRGQHGARQLGHCADHFRRGLS